MAYNIQTKVAILSATLELTGDQLAKLAAARDPFAAAVDGTQDPGLLAVRSLLNEIAASVMGKSITAPGKKPMSEAQRAAILANAAKGRAAYKAKMDARARRDALGDLLDDPDELDEDLDDEDGDL